MPIIRKWGDRPDLLLLGVWAVRVLLKSIMFSSNVAETKAKPSGLTARSGRRPIFGRIASQTWCPDTNLELDSEGNRSEKLQLT